MRWLGGCAELAVVLALCTHGTHKCLPSLARIPSPALISFVILWMKHSFSKLIFCKDKGQNRSIIGLSSSLKDIWRNKLMNILLEKKKMENKIELGKKNPKNPPPKSQDKLFISWAQILLWLSTAAVFIIKGFVESLHFDVNIWKYDDWHRKTNS